ncbi:MAG TPA: hypothetical protein VMM92_12920 [Thermoanaerobaculia bacterium]|nr:hypothetical protein [Thermoanaerobaculia bacterium]
MLQRDLQAGEKRGEDLDHQVRRSDDRELDTRAGSAPASRSP